MQFPTKSRCFKFSEINDGTRMWQRLWQRHSDAFFIFNRWETDFFWHKTHTLIYITLTDIRWWSRPSSFFVTSLSYSYFYSSLICVTVKLWHNFMKKKKSLLSRWFSVKNRLTPKSLKHKIIVFLARWRKVIGVHSCPKGLTWHHTSMTLNGECWSSWRYHSARHSETSNTKH